MIDRRTLLRSLTPLAATLLTLGCRPDAPQAASNTAAKAVPVPLTESAAPVGAVVVVSVAGVEPGGEPVDAALQTEAQWGTEQASYRARVVADASTLALRFEPVVTGVYAIVAVQPNAPKPQAGRSRSRRLRSRRSPACRPRRAAAGRRAERSLDAGRSGRRPPSGSDRTVPRCR